MDNLHSLLQGDPHHSGPIDGQHPVPHAQLTQSGRRAPLHDGCYGEEAAAVGAHHVQTEAKADAVGLEGHLHGVGVVGKVAVGVCGGCEGHCEQWQ